MSGNHKGPRTGSRLYEQLAKLHAIGGEASALGWINATGWAGSIDTFLSDVGRLVGQGVVFQRGDLFIVSDDGLAWLGIPPDAPRCEAPVVVGPRYSNGRQALSAKNKPNVRLMREGSFDYRNIPSLHGSERVSYRSSLNVTGGEQQG